MSATLASNGSPTARRATMRNSQFQENNRLENEKGPAHKVCLITGTLFFTLIALYVQIFAYRATRI